MTTTERIFLGVLGSALLGVGVFALGQGHLSLPWRVGGGLLLVVFGGNCIFAAWRDKPSWLSRIGPLP
jgi:hypothetical protein